MEKGNVLPPFPFSWLNGMQIIIVIIVVGGGVGAVALETFLCSVQYKGIVLHRVGMGGGY